MGNILDDGTVVVSASFASSRGRERKGNILAKGCYSFPCP